MKAIYWESFVNFQISFSTTGAMDQILSPQNTYVEALNSNVIVFGDRVFRR